jgi:hypothetical protein
MVPAMIAEQARVIEALAGGTPGLPSGEVAR